MGAPRPPPARTRCESGERERTSRCSPVFANGTHQPTPVLTHQRSRGTMERSCGSKLQPHIQEARSSSQLRAFVLLGASVLMARSPAGAHGSLLSSVFGCFSIRCRAVGDCKWPEPVYAGPAAWRPSVRNSIASRALACRPTAHQHPTSILQNSINNPIEILAICGSVLIDKYRFAHPNLPLNAQCQNQSAFAGTSLNYFWLLVVRHMAG